MVVHYTPLNLTAVPACGLSCLAKGLSTSTSCATTNTTCLCLDQGFSDFVTSCAKATCSVKDQLTTQRETSISCGVQYYDSDTALRVVHITLFTFQSIFFFLRMVSRAKRLAPWGRDDTTIVIAWLFSVGFFVGSLIETTLHVGIPYWARSFYDIDQSLLVFFVCQVFYNLELGLVKISICFLYMRIFTGQTFQRIMWATQVFIATVIVVFFAAGFAQCRPFSTFWTSWDGVRVGKCFNLNAFAYALAAIHIALDVWMLVLPAVQVWKLNMSFRRKMEVTFMFSIGLLLTAVSIVRLTTLQWFAKNPLDIRSFYATAVWSVVELSTGIFVACLPAARIVLIKYAGVALAATGLSRSDKSHLPQHEKNSGNSSGERLGGGTSRSKYKLRMPALGGTRLSSSIGRELQGSKPSRGFRVSEEQLTGRGWDSPVELDTVASKDELKTESKTT